MSEYSMNKAQRSYDNQVPEDNYPPEPDEDKVMEWAYEGGYIMCYEAFRDNHCNRDFVGWLETHWDDVVTWYIEEHENE